MPFSNFQCATDVTLASELLSWRTLSSTVEIDSKLSSLGLYYDRTELALICTRCKCALQPSDRAVSKHLGEKHGITRQARQGLNHFVQSLALPDPNDLPLRRDGTEPRPHLVVKVGAACCDCDFRSTSVELVQRHRKTHDRSCSRRSSGMEGNLRLQSWSQTGSRRYWTVTSDEHKRMVKQYPLDELSPRRLQKVVQLCQEEQQRIAEGDIVHLAALANPDTTTTSNWMRRTR